MALALIRRSAACYCATNSEADTVLYTMTVRFGHKAAEIKSIKIRGLPCWEIPAATENVDWFMVSADLLIGISKDAPRFYRDKNNNYYMITISCFCGSLRERNRLIAVERLSRCGRDLHNTVTMCSEMELRNTFASVPPPHALTIRVFNF